MSLGLELLAVMADFHPQLKLCLIFKFHRGGFSHEELEDVHIFGELSCEVDYIGATSLSLYFVHVCRDPQKTN